ncbi:MAG: hypothetical protein KGI27_06165 [Thaumarchaeota archaeon]|nr:hypothetical protein [Nitrososphaerota archaeon]
MKSIYLAILAILIVLLPLNFVSGQNQTESTNSIPQNAIRTTDGGWVTPLQTTENGTKLTIHYEKGVNVTGKIMPTGPPPVMDMQITPSSKIYQQGDWIAISGTEDEYLMQKFGERLVLSIDNPRTGQHWCCDDFQAGQQGTFYYSFKMPDTFQTSGSYELVASPANSTDQYTADILYYGILPAPLDQLKLGIYTLDVECREGFVHVIRIEDKSAACVKTDTAQKLVERGWADPGIVPSKRAFRIVTPSFSSDLEATVIGNQTFYYTTLNDSTVTYHGTGAIPIKFHGLEFTIFPGVFSGGPPGSCGVTSIGSEVKFPDGKYESLRVQIPGSPCAENYTQIDLSNHTHPQAGLEVYHGKTRLLVSTEGQSSFVMLTTPCDTPFPQSNTGIPVFYMPANYTGKLCVKYSNPNDPFQAGFDILEARDYSKKAEGTIVTPVPYTVPHGNNTVVYTINSGPKAGFYRMLISCPGMQLAIGYDNGSNFVRGDFPWLDQGFFCGIGHDFQITGTSGIGVKFIPYK